MDDKIRIGILSDLHLEFEGLPKDISLFVSDAQGAPSIAGEKRLGPKLDEIKAARPDLVLIGGDTAGSWAMAALYARLAARYLGVPTIVIAGNHEGYDGTPLPDVFAGLRGALDGVVEPGVDVRFLEAAMPDHLASAEFLIRGRRLVVIGSTLWVDFCLYGVEHQSEAKLLAERAISDFHRGRIAHDAPLRPMHLEELHHRARARIAAIFEADLARERLEGIARPDYVVLSHMAPSKRSIAAQYKDDLVSAYFASNLKGLIDAYAPALWIHGHVHDPADYRIGRTRVIANPRGYLYHEPAARDYRPQLVEV